MNNKRLWLGAWAAASALWVLYWAGMSLALGVEAIHELIANLEGPVLIGGLILSVPAGLYLAGALVACVARCGKGRASGS